MGKLNKQQSLKPLKKKKKKKKGLLNRITDFINDFFSINNDENLEKSHENSNYDTFFEYSDFNNRLSYEEYLENEFLRKYNDKTKRHKNKEVPTRSTTEKNDMEYLNKPKNREVPTLNTTEKNDMEYLNKPQKKSQKSKSFKDSLMSRINEYEKTGHFGFDLKNDEKKIIGILIFTIILCVILGGAYYFLIFEPMNEELNNEKIAKIDQIHSLFKGPLADAKEVEVLEDSINNCNTSYQVKNVDVLRPATALWRDYQYKNINESKDVANRVILSYENNKTEHSIISADEAIKIVQDNDGTVLSNIKFKKPDTVAVPIEISRLQAGNGLIKTGSKIDIYSINSSDYSNNEGYNESYNENTNSSPNLTDENTNQSTTITTDNINSENSEISDKNPKISGCTVLAIMRSKDSGTINRKNEELKTINTNNKNLSNERSYTYTQDVEETLKEEASGEYSDEETDYALNNYGLKLSDYERISNIGELDCQYLILVEVPREDVQFILDNMDHLVLTIPVDNGPNWMIEEIKQSDN